MSHVARVPKQADASARLSRERLPVPSVTIKWPQVAYSHLLLILRRSNINDVGIVRIHGLFLTADPERIIWTLCNRRQGLLRPGCPVVAALHLWRGRNVRSPHAARIGFRPARDRADTGLIRFVMNIGRPAGRLRSHIGNIVGGVTTRLFAALALFGRQAR
jgi:hypothetical protein